MLEIVDISKHYGSLAANRDITFAVAPGEAVGLLGENGAGKSTLLSILAGRLRPDSGHLEIDSTRLDLTSPREAMRQGIAAVYQHFSLVETLTVREQLRLAGWDSRSLPPMLVQHFTGNERIGALSLGQRQRVELAKSLTLNPRYLLLDEPTSILTPAEVKRLFRELNALRKQGLAIIFVSHKLPEVLAFCDRVVVLRKGEVTAEVAQKQGNWSSSVDRELLSAMFGSAPTLSVESTASSSARPSVSDHQELLSVSYRPDSATPKSLVLNDGEIFAIVGIDGQGQQQLAEFCTGYSTADGEIKLRGGVLQPGHPTAFRRAGITLLSGDRLGEGSVADLSVALNLILKRQRENPFSNRGMLNRAAIDDNARHLIHDWNIDAPGPDAPIHQLSGGNIQKVLLARELPIASSVLVATNPTHGLDVNSQAAVWTALHDIADRRSGVIVFTTELDEVIQHADRVAVMYNSQLSEPQLVSTDVRPTLERMMSSGW